MVSLPAQTATLLERAGEIDWRDTEGMGLHALPLLSELSRPDHLRCLLGSLATNEGYWPMCEREYGFTKFVLYVDPKDRFRLRLHVMKTAPEETPHSHRMNFVTRLLNGSYVHRLYTPEDNGIDMIRSEQINCVLRHKVDSGNGYALKHTLIHSLEVVEEPCITLMMRGAAQKDRAVNIDVNTNEVWWQRSDQHPAYHTSAKVSMPGELVNLRQLLQDQGLV